MPSLFKKDFMEILYNITACISSYWSRLSPMTTLSWSLRNVAFFPKHIVHLNKNGWDSVSVKGGGMNIEIGCYDSGHRWSSGIGCFFSFEGHFLGEADNLKCIQRRETRMMREMETMLWEEWWKNGVVSFGEKQRDNGSSH